MSTAAIFGLMIGSIGSKFATNWGRRRSILVSNLVIVIATAPSFFSSNFWMLLMSRFIIGIPAAVLVNASSLYQSEVIPAEWMARIGTNINLGIVLGIFFAYSFGLLLPAKDDIQAEKDDNLWRVSYSLQLIPVFISTIIWFTWLRTEPIQFLISKSEAQNGSASYKECLATIGKNHDAHTEEQQVEVFNRIQQFINESQGKK